MHVEVEQKGCQDRALRYARFNGKWWGQTVLDFDLSCAVKEIMFYYPDKVQRDVLLGEFEKKSVVPSAIECTFDVQEEGKATTVFVYCNGGVGLQLKYGLLGAFLVSEAML